MLRPRPVSIAVITDESGAVLERDSFDAWGKWRFPPRRTILMAASPARTLRR